MSRLTRFASMAYKGSERCFMNQLPDFSDICSTSSFQEADNGHAVKDVLLLLRSPSSSLSETFLRAALELKDEVVHATWCSPDAMPRRTFDMYKGTLGTALLCLKVYQVTGNLDNLHLCRDIIHGSSAASVSMRQLRAVAAKFAGDKHEVDHFVKLLSKVGKQASLVVDDGESGTPYELLYGHAGYIWATLFVNKQLGFEAIPATIVRPVLDAILTAGHVKDTQTNCPLMYHWHGKPYWGAAHGLAGIMHCLLHFQLEEQDLKAVKGVLMYMIRNRFAESKNYPSREGNSGDKLVQWCHGAPGVALTLCKASEVFVGEKVFEDAAVEAGEVVWKRGLLRKVGLCHGISGNAYTFLALYRLLHGERHLYRAKAFGCFLLDRARDLITSGEMHGGDHPYSLFEGLAGMACLFLDLVNPKLARFPGYEL